MTTTISASNIGKFRSTSQASAYQTSMGIKKDVERAATTLLLLDESEHDANRDSLNYVLVQNVRQDNDGTLVSGYAEFEPGESSARSMVYQESFGQGSIVKRAQLQQLSSGDTLYQNASGAVTVTKEGNLIFDPTPPAITWDETPESLRNESKGQQEPFAELRNWIDQQMEPARQDMLSRL